MPLFRKARGDARPSTAPGPAASGGAAVPPVEPLMGDPDAHRFRAALAQGTWQEFHDFLDATRDWDDRHFYVHQLSDIQGRPEWLDEWIAARAGSPLPLLFRGAHGIHWAWQARGMGYAKTVAQDSWAVFHSRLVGADQDLARAAALDPEDPTPHARSVHSALGLALGKEEIRRRFGEATRRHRWHYFAHMPMLQALAAKWYGSHAEMFEFARATSAQAPEGLGVHVVVARAHLETWQNVLREYPDGRERQSRYFSDEAVRQEVRRAADLSVSSPRYLVHKASAADRNVFAMCFWLMRDSGAQLDQMRRIGSLIQQIPWGYQGNPGQIYGQARADALREIPEAAAPA